MRNKYIELSVLIALILFSTLGCNKKGLQGVYYSKYTDHFGVGYLLQINQKKSFTYLDNKGNVAGSWSRKGDTLYLYSAEFKKAPIRLNKDFSYFLHQVKDSAKALDLWLEDMAPGQPHQVTTNDSMDIFIIEDDKLYPINEKQYNVIGINKSVFLQKAKDSLDYKYWKHRLGIESK